MYIQVQESRSTDGGRAAWGVSRYSLAIPLDLADADLDRRSGQVTSRSPGRGLALDTVSLPSHCCLICDIVSIAFNSLQTKNSHSLVVGVGETETAYQIDCPLSLNPPLDILFILL